MTKKLLLVYDVDGWAWHHMACDISRHAPDIYNIHAVSPHQFLSSQYRGADAICHFSWVGMPLGFPQRLVTLLAHHGAMHEPCPCLGNPNCGHHDHDWPAVAASRDRNYTSARDHLSKSDGVISCNPVLDDFAVSLGANSAWLPAGIDPEIYKPIFPVDTRSHQKLRVGWCGQRSNKRPHTKGFSWLFEPVRDRCADFCEFLVNSRHVGNALSRTEMVDWYNGIDVFLCTSISEGSPMPPLEALSCGRAVVTTAVGDMPYVVRDGETGFLTGTYHDDRTAEDVIERTCVYLRRLHEDRELLAHMGRQGRTMIEQNRNWQTLAPKWLRFIAGD